MQFLGEQQIAVEAVKTCWNASDIAELGNLCASNAIQAEYFVGIVMLIIGIFIGWQLGIRKK